MRISVALQTARASSDVSRLLQQARLGSQTCNGGLNGIFDNGKSSDLKECLNGSTCKINGAGYIYCEGCGAGFSGLR